MTCSSRRSGRACGVVTALEVHLEIEAIALVDGDLAALGQDMQGRVQRACEQMLGVPGVSVRVRFLPSKTVTVTREVC